ncbi:gliding motility-associated C-terminal domain-containing protein [Tenacibaculum tangerinum]|uniref:Gliding motility-associated C-terminal domain-containing protein n=1 Tax=Tenacibaculum tangerinum TaxID=3038772 RepID=A0ABY8L8T7_9FLAO|nr:gliding motility-associated C-terminal domain-containing protein [Tenacibaculum tangerinum]WGH76588.1 gliding motility-associated C-terminal domain-containing protein [Tenacibaculum tangerinum]
MENNYTFSIRIFKIAFLYALLLSLSLHAAAFTSNEPSTSIYVDDALPEAKTLISAPDHTDTTTTHLFSHGRSGALFIEGQWRNPEEIVRWIRKTQLIKGSRHLNIYGCEFAKGEKGAAAVAYLENNLNITISASINITGKDGDWILEAGNTYNKPLNINYSFNLQDTDTDAIVDNLDLDDDNDGITDSSERTNTSTSLLSYNHNDNNAANHTAPSIMNSSIIASAEYYTTGPGITGTRIAKRASISNINATSLTQARNLGEYIQMRFTTQGSPAYIGSFLYQFGMRSGNSAYRIGVDISDNNFVTYTNIAANVSVGTTGTTQVYYNYNREYFLRPNTTYTIRFYFFSSSSGTAYFDDHRFAAYDAKDTDGDTLPDHLDLDSDNDGCFDVAESGGLDGNNDGILDNGSTTPPAVVVDGNGQVTNGTGGYNGLATNQPEYNATALSTTATPQDQTVTNAAPASFSVTTSAATATSYTTGTPVYGTPGNADAGITYQWYLGDPNASGTPLSDTGVYSGTNSATLTISNTSSLYDNAYYVVLTHTNNVCIEETYSALLLANPCDPLASGNTDTDDDGVADICDLDDDNDGILDVNESCIIAPSSTAEESFEDGTNIPNGSTPNQNWSSNFNFVANGSDVDFQTRSPDYVRDVEGSNHYDPPPNGSFSFGALLCDNDNATTSGGDGLGFIISQASIISDGIAVGSQFNFSFEYAPGHHYTPQGFDWEADVDTRIAVWYLNVAPGSVTAFTDLPVTPTENVLPGDFVSAGLLNGYKIMSPNSWNTFTGSLNWTGGDIIFAVQVLKGATTADLKEIAFVDNFIFQVDGSSACSDSDLDGTPDYLDLDSDNDGCFDVVESGGLDGNNDGILDDGSTTPPAVVVDGNGQVTNGTGGYDGLATNQPEYNATALSTTATPQDQTVTNAAPASFSVTTSASTATSYTAGTPVYGTPGNADAGITYQWYLGDPNASGIPLSDTGVYSGTSTATLAISDTSSLYGNAYYVVIGHTDNVCIEETYSAFLLADPCDPIASGNTDTDDDGVADICDLDDDNDGILDVNEYGDLIELTPANLGLGLDEVNATVTNVDISNLLGLPAGTILVSGTGIHTGGAAAPTNFWSGSGRPVTNIQITTLPGYGVYTQFIIDGALDPFDVEELISNDGVSYTRFAGEVTPPANVLYFDYGVENTSGVTYEPFVLDNVGFKSNAPVSNFSFYNLKANPQISNFKIYIVPPLDTDDDGLPNHLDLDSDNDGCFDVVESGGLDGNNDGILDDGSNTPPAVVVDGNGQVTNGTGGYDGATGNEYSAIALNTTATPQDQTVTNAAPASFSVTTSASTATSYTAGTPVYGTPGNADAGITYQWYLGDPNTSGTPLSDTGVYSGTSTATLTISDTSVLYGNAYYVVIGHTNYVCTETYSAVLLADSCDPIASGNTDTDNDGVADICDLDDDNDGILDVNEQSTCANPTIDLVGLVDDFGTGTTRTETQYISSTYTFEPSGQVNDGEYIVINNTGFIGAWGTWQLPNIIEDHTPGDTNGKMLLVNAAVAPGEFYRRNLTGFLPNSTMELRFWARDICPSCPTRPNITYSIRDMSDNILATANTGDFTSSQWEEFVLTANSGANNQLQFVLINNQNNSSGNDLVIDDISFSNKVCDTDQDGIPDHLDEDSDNDGCPDVVESGGLDTNNDGVLDGTGFASSGTVEGGTGGYNGANGTETVSDVISNVAIAPSPAAVCLGSDITLTATPTGLRVTDFGPTGATTDDTTIPIPAGDYVYRWYDTTAPATTLSTASTLDLTNVTTNGTYAVEVSTNNNTFSADNTGCGLEQTITVTVNPLPTAPTINPVNATICAGDDAVFTVSGDSGAVVSYDGAATGTVTLGAGGTATITVPSVSSETTINVTDSTNPTTGCIIPLTGVSATVSVVYKPILTVGDMTCDATTYTVNYISDGATITASGGTVDPITNTITGIALGDDITITASNGAGCDTTISVTGPDTCPTDCVQPDLSLGQAVCDGVGATTYTVSYTENTGATLLVVGGTDNNNGTITGNIGTNMTVTATNGNCELSLAVTSPVACDDPCENTAISIGGTSCATDGSATYDVTFTATAGATVTASVGTVGAGVVTDIPSGTEVVLTVSFPGCAENTVVTVPSADCPLCDLPVLTVGEITCDATTYTVNYISDGATITASGGTVDATTNTITGIALGDDITITASNGAGCDTTISVTGPDTCPTDCVQPDLSLGQAVCDGVGATTYTVSYTENTGATLLVVGGTDNNNGTITGNIGTNMTVTATNGNCELSLAVTSPVACDDPCENTAISIGGTSCATDGSATYDVTFTATAGATVTASVGTVGAGVVTDIPSGTEVVLTVSFPGCAENTVVTVPSADCPLCDLPVLTVGEITCDATTYSITYFSDGATITASGGTVDPTTNTITGIALGDDITITASNGAGCDTTISVTGPDTCPTDCVQPDLSLGQAVCDGVGATTYTVSYTENTGATLLVVGGTDNNNGTITGNIGTNMTVTATNGNCELSLAVTSPVACDDPCENTAISIGGTSCATDGSATYDVTFTATAGATVTASVGTVGAGVVTDIPSGTEVVLTVSFPGCAENTVVTVPSADCPLCDLPVLTAGEITCDATTYTVNYFSDGATITASGGTVDPTTNTITGIALGDDITITASNGAGCDTTISVTGPDTCPTDCVQPDLSLGQAVCDGVGATTYTVSYTENTGATLLVVGGTDNNNGTITGNIGTNMTVTATNGNCELSLAVTSPVACDDPCENTAISIGGTSCATDGSATYDVTFTATAGATVTASVGTVGAGVVTDIPSGTEVVLTVSFPGCAENTVVTVPSADCPLCDLPVLTVGEITCDATTYTVNYFSDGATITASGGTVDATTNTITGIALGDDITITASNGVGCDTTISVTGPDTCPTDCVQPDLSLGQAVCDGVGATTYTVSYTENTGATLLVVGGTDNNNGTITGNIGTNMTVTATNGNCELSLAVTSPVACDDPCENTAISIGGTSCATDGSATYDLTFTATAGATVTASVGTVGAGVVTDIPSGTEVVLTVSFPGCAENTVVTVPSADCPLCDLPVLTVGEITCDATTYTVNYFSDGATITASGGTVDATTNTITGIALGDDITITASNVAGCDTTISVTGPDTCPTDCVQPDLSLGQAVCDGVGATTYTVSYTENTGATLLVVGGTDNNNGTITGNIGTNMTVTATNGNCELSLAVTSPVACDDPCENTAISIGGTSCATDGSATYDVTFTATAGATVTASVGTVGAGVVTDIPSGTEVVLTVSFPGCAENTVVTVPSADCPLCDLPVLTVGEITCDATTYTVNYFSDGATITASGGTVDATTNTITGIALGDDITITASNGAGCDTTISVTGPDTCPTDCVQPDLSLGQAVCDGVGATTYTVSYTENTGATLLVVGGTDNNNGTITGNIGTNMTVTATNGNCELSLAVTSPVACDDPCENTAISIGGTSCATDGSATYDVTFTATAGATVTASVGTVGAGVVTDIPSGTEVVLTVSFPGCAENTVVTVPSADCPLCDLPVLTVGEITCDATTYTVNYFSDGATITASGGTVDATTNTITGIALGDDITITASNVAGCDTTISVTGPDTCPTDCVQPDLSLGQAVCDGVGATTYTVSYTENTGATLLVVGGTDNNNGTITGNIGTNMTVTATNGNCELSLAVTSPVACDDPCENTAISIGGTSCATDGSATYDVTFTATAGATVTASVGTVGAGVVTDIPSGTEVVLTVSFPGCAENTVVTVPSADCPLCDLPVLTVGEITCDATTYTVNYFSDGATITASGGTVDATTNTITGIALGDDITITASNGAGCDTTISVTGPDTCPTDCVQPDLSLGQAVCDGVGATTYTVSYTENTGATLLVVGGTDNNNGTITGNIGTNMTVTATNGNCEISLAVTSPVACDDPCENTAISIGGTSCATDGSATYDVTFTATAGATVTASVGTVGAGVVTDIPSGTEVVLTVSFPGCAENTVVTVPSADCPLCDLPVLTVGEITCDATTYTVNYFSDGATITASGGTVDATTNTITGIALGDDITITASNVAGCDTTISVTGPDTCPTDCVQPDLSLGQAVCDGVGATTYTVSYTENTGATLLVVGGTDNNNGTITGTIGTNMTVTATNGNCELSLAVTSPVACDDPCENTAISIGGTSCATDGSATYDVTFTATAGATVTASVGTVGAGVVTDIPSGTEVVLTVSFPGCAENTVVTVPSADCPLCDLPVLTVGEITCDATTYTVNYFSDGATITASGGTVDATTNTITGIALGDDITITASNGAGCDTTISVTGPDTCPTDCVQPDLSLGQAVCDGVGATTYTVSYTENTGATLLVVGGTDNNNGTITGNIGTNMTVTATNGNCELSLAVTSPVACDDPCENTAISIGGTSCATDGSATYDVTFTATAGATVTASVGTVGAGVVTDIPSGTEVVLTVSFPGCAENTVVTVPSADCPLCDLPVLTVGEITCDATTYSVNYISDGATITASGGTVDATTNTITGIALGDDITITASNGAGCDTTISVTGPDTCPTDCVQPDLSLGQAVCDGVGATTYTVSYTENTGATLLVVGGTDNNNGTITGNIGTNMTVTATNGNCELSLAVTSPVACDDPCENTAISIGGTSCATDGSATYDVTFTATAGATVTASVGTVGAGVVTDIPSGTEVVLTVSFPGCAENTVVTVPSADCPLCDLPVLTVGEITCDATTYTVNYFSDGATITASGGTVDATTNTITGIALGDDITITASNGAGCDTTISVTGPDTCPTDCVQPDLSLGQAVCDGVGATTYTVSYTENTGATLLVVGGTDNNNGTITGNIGTNMTVTATNGNCELSLAVTSPVACDDPCENTAISIGGTSCATDGSATYDLTFTATAGATVTASVGTVSAGVVTDIPSGTDVVLTVSFPGCAENTVVTVPSADCPLCDLPVLTVGEITCDATTYTVNYFSDGATITASGGTVDATTNTITGIPLGDDITITASNGAGCDTTISVTGPDTCPTDCVQPDLSLGQAVCDGVGATTYTVSYTENTGATLLVVGGTDNNNGTITGNIGTNMTVTATNGNCELSLAVTSPVACDDPCENTAISIGGTSCATDGSATYDLTFTATAGATVTASVGTVGAGVVTDIPSGTDVVLTVSFPGCAENTVVTVPSADCPLCDLPVLTVGEITCDATTYTVNYFSDGATITASGGTVDATTNTITGIALGDDITITASNGAGCDTTISVTGPDTCPTDCVQPDLSLGQAVCDGVGATTYTVSYTENTGATLLVVGGTDNNNGTITGTIGTNMTITATNGNCELSLAVTSPVACDDPCENTAISIGGTSCATDGSATYDVTFTATAGATVTASVGTVGAGVVTGIPSGTEVVLTVSFPGCAENTVVTVPSKNCKRPSISLLKTATFNDENGDGIAQSGETITYSFEVINTGNVALNNISINDDLLGGIVCTIPTLNIGEVNTSCSATYSITQIDVDTGSVTNAAVVTATDSDNNTISDNSDDPNNPTDDDPDADGDPDDPTVSTLQQQPAIEVTKTMEVSGVNVGDLITYTISVENTGNMTLDNLSLEDTLTNGFGDVISLTTEPTFVYATLGSPEGTLLPKEIAEYTATFVITQQALNSSTVSNTVLVTADANNGEIVEDVSDDGDDFDGNTVDDPTEITLGCLEIFNEFTPNGDGIDETFVINCIEQYPNNTLEVYNRWGNLVFKTKGYRNDWNGFANVKAVLNTGSDLPVGTYYYVLDLGDNSKPRVGWLYIHR